MLINKSFLYFIAFLYFSFSFSQNDELLFKNGDKIVGEFKKLDKGIVVFKTVYSDSDFKIDFDDVVSFSLKELFLINLSNGMHVVGSIMPLDNDFIIKQTSGNEFMTSKNSIVSITSIDEAFFSRFSGEFDVGYNLTKSQNNKQFNFSSKLGYKSSLWLMDSQFNMLNTSQNNVEDIRRDDLSLTTRRFLYNQWYSYIDYSYLLSTELGIKSRQNPNVGIGKSIVSSNVLYFVSSLGVSYNLEDYYDTALSKNSSELLFILQFEIFNIKDFDFYSEVSLIPSLSQKNRLRSDGKFSLKYDLPLDFYIKSSFNFNYDNQPAAVGNEFDYVFTSGVGWEL